MGEGKAHPSCKRGIKPRIYYTRRIGLPEPSIEVILTCGTTCGWVEAIITSMLFYYEVGKAEAGVNAGTCCTVWSGACC
jgi:hypothetical protein